MHKAPRSNNAIFSFNNRHENFRGAEWVGQKHEIISLIHPLSMWKYFTKRPVVRSRSWEGSIYRPWCLFLLR